MKTALQSLLLTGLLLQAADSLHAQSMVPASMNYQGMLTDANGDVVAGTAPENRNVEFRIYSLTTGGTPLWGEAQTVTVYKGHFSVVLGNGTAVGGAPSGPAAFAAVFANATSENLYFGITPQGGQEFAPRQKLLSSAYALRSRVAERVNQTTGDSTFNWVYANNLTMQGHTKVNGANVLEFGTNDPQRSRNTTSGQIGYQVYSNGLDILGAGQESADRRVTIWAEGGTEFKGMIKLPFYGQSIQLYDAFNGIGVQSDGTYSRAYKNFAWYRGGSHNSAALSNGGGTTMATLTPGGFTLNEGIFTGNGSGLTNLNPNSLPNNYNYLGINGTSVIEFGRGTFGKQADSGKIGYGTFSGNALDIVGAGNAGNGSDRRIKLWGEAGTELTGSLQVNSNTRLNGYTEAFGPIYAKSNVVIEGNGTLNFATPSRTGQLINLWGNEFGIGIGSGTLYNRVNSGGTFKWYTGGSHDDNGPGLNGGEIANWNNERIDFYRRVHMGSHLYVAGFENRSMNYAYYSKQGGNNNTSTGAGSGIWPVSIMAVHRVVGSEFNAVSDARLKVVQGISDSAADLLTLKNIEIVNYTMKDKVTGGNRPMKKVVAQQVEKVYPQAVLSNEGMVPDIYRNAKIDKGFITLEGMAKLNLTKGDKIRLIQTDREIMTEITQVTDKGFQVKEDLTGEIFVYGRQVKDLRSVDYEGLAMLNVSATQELSKRLDAQTAELAKVSQERDALAKEVAAMRAAAAAQTKRLASIEAKIEALGRPAATPVSLKAEHGAE